jgi:hypothetical protein
MPDVFDYDSRHPKYSRETEQDFQTVEVYGMKCEIHLYEDGHGWAAEHKGAIRYARSKQAALESMIEDLQIDLYTEE